MAKRFYSIQIPIFGSVAMLLMCIILFLLPFALRGARLGLKDMQNNVADWLPQDYPETQDLKEFRKYFVGDQFVVVSGPWCKERDTTFEKEDDLTTFEKMKLAIEADSLENEPTLKQANKNEELRARRKGDELGLLFTGDYHETWGERNEKWLQGRNDKWYFINRKGELYEWEGQNNVVEGIKRFVERSSNGRNKANGKYVDTFKLPADDQQGKDNPFYENPEKICCRPFKSVISGPDVFEQMAGEGGTLRIGKYGEEDLSTFEAKLEAHQRLTGAMFGPTPANTFQWTFESLIKHVHTDRAKALQKEPIYRERFERFVTEQINTKYNGEIDGLRKASKSAQLEAWYRAWYQMELDPPPRQTCLIVTLNEPIISELARAIGRPMLGKPRGRLPEIAINKCEIDKSDFHMGGPPVDNVAIDEEGTNTLVRLAGLSLIIGMSLAYLSFGSIRVACMLFFVGGVAAIASLSYVWFAGQTMDAILMTMPSLVYVMGLSSAVHIVNYYRDACHEYGSRRAVEIAVKHSWFPCLLASFTTALGLISLTTSNLRPIYKFGLFSAIATMVTVVLLFTFLPSALTIWKPGYERLPKNQPQNQRKGMGAAVGRTWEIIGNWIVGHYGIVVTVCLGIMLFFAVGLTKIKTTVQLLKLFDSDAKILHDYRWMEQNLGELVPAELVVCVDSNVQREPYVKRVSDEQKTAALAKLPPGSDPKTVDDLIIEYDRKVLDLKYSMLERVELSARVRRQLEKFFGPEGLAIVGSGMSTDVFTPLYRIDSQLDSLVRKQFSASLFAKKDDMLAQDYLAEAGHRLLPFAQREEDATTPDKMGREMWRISIRLAALNNVDYGQFVNDLKRVVEPILSAYRFRTEILQKLQQKQLDAGLEKSTMLVLGRNPDARDNSIAKELKSGASIDRLVDQTFIFSDTLQDLLENRGIADKLKKDKPNPRSFYVWLDPAISGTSDPSLTAEELAKRVAYFQPENFAKVIKSFDCTVLIEDDPLFDPKFLAEHANTFVDARDHKFVVDPKTNLPVAGELTAMERKKTGEDVSIATIYTGIVPIVYKAQRALLQSLIQSIGLAFVMISFVMMVLLRDWDSPIRPTNLLNIRGGLVAMIPNVFPVVIVFGFMGHLGIEVDIGSMMTASVAMGVAVDDTIHFLNWYRLELNEGRSRVAAIKEAYNRVATAMTQTTLIGGLGLAAFSLSTFTPTQRFGVLMLFLLLMALVGDLILLPAILASPLGKFFGKQKSTENHSAPAPSITGVSHLRIVSDDEAEDSKPEEQINSRSTAEPPFPKKKSS